MRRQSSKVRLTFSPVWGYKGIENAEKNQQAYFSRVSYFGSIAAGGHAVRVARMRKEGIKKRG